MKRPLAQPQATTKPKSSPPPPGSPPPGEGAKSLQWCLSVTIAVAMNAGCASVQMKPPTGVCPPAAVAAVKELGWPRYVVMLSDHRLTYEAFTNRGRHVVHAEAVVGRWVGGMNDHEPQPYSLKGALFYGIVWPGDPVNKEAWFYYTEAVLSDGRRIPVCLQTTETWRSGSTPEAPIIDNVIAPDFVLRWSDR